MQQIVKVGGKIILSGISALAVLSMFCLIYSYGKLHIEQPSGATDFTDEPYSYMAQMEEGFSWNIMDGNGYNNESTFEKVDVLLMGASDMEAGRLHQDESISFLLNTKYLPEYHSYNIAKSGHIIYFNVQNLQAAYEWFQPSRYVVIDIDNTELAIDSMNLVLNDQFPKAESVSDSFKKWIINYIPATANISKALKNWIGKSPKAIAADSGNVDMEDYQTVLEEFLGYAKNIMGGGTRLIILYHPSDYEVDENGMLRFDSDPEYDRLFEKVCSDHDIIFVNMKDEFARMYTEDHVLPHGFVNTVWGEGHMNRYGHEACAKALAETIDSLEREKENGADH